MFDSIDPNLASRLPFDLILLVISRIDSSTAEGRRTLAAFARLSRACRPAAENALYRYATFHPDHLRALLLDLLGQGKGGQTAHIRAKRLIGRIEHLTLQDGWREPVAPVTLLWQAASLSPGIPLFPRVRQLAIVSSSKGASTVYPEPVPPRSRPAVDSMPPGILIFGDVDVCVAALQPVGLLSYLPTRRVISYTAHDIMIGSIPDVPTPEWLSWGPLKLYNRFPEDITPFAQVVCQLEAKARALDLAPIRIINCGAKWKQYSLDGLALVLDDDGSTTPFPPVCPWKPSPSNKIQLEWYDPDDSSCPSCGVCGKCSEVMELTRRSKIRGDQQSHPTGTAKTRQLLD